MSIKTKIFLFTLVLLAINVAGRVFLGKTTKEILLKCPHEYKTLQEKVAAFEKFTNDFYDKNPDASIDEMLDARRIFYIQHDCKEELELYDEAMQSQLND